MPLPLSQISSNVLSCMRTRTCLAKAENVNDLQHYAISQPSQPISHIGNLLIEIEIENCLQHVPYAPVHNMYRMRRLLFVGPPNNAIQETYKSGLDR
jgi:hypothetical protein